MGWDTPENNCENIEHTYFWISDMLETFELIEPKDTSSLLYHYLSPPTSHTVSIPQLKERLAERDLPVAMEERGVRQGK